MSVGAALLRMDPARTGLQGHVPLDLLYQDLLSAARQHSQYNELSWTDTPQKVCAPLLVLLNHIQALSLKEEECSIKNVLRHLVVLKLRGD